jgi:hypothetical protein
LREEVLVSNTRLREQREVGVEGSVVGLLNDQTTKRESIPSEEALFVFNRAGVKDRGPHRQVYLGHVSKSFKLSILSAP